MSTGSTISGAKFVNAKPVYFPKFDKRLDNDNRGGNAYRTLSFRDLDGSVTGIRNSQVLLHDGESDSVATDDSCVIHPDWNAAVCKADIDRLSFSDTRGEFPRAVDLESPTTRFALLASIDVELLAVANERDGRLWRTTGRPLPERSGAA